MIARLASGALLSLWAVAAVGAQRSPGELLSPGVSAASPDSTFHLSGVVTHEATGRPLPRVLVTVPVRDGSLKAVSDSLGIYRIAHVPRGRYTITAQARGYYIEYRVLTVLCPGDLVDFSGRPIAAPGECDEPRQVLNFFMREDRIR